MEQISTQSMRMAPPAGSTRRNKAIPKDDFPGGKEARSATQTTVGTSVTSKYPIEGIFNVLKRLCEDDRQRRQKSLTLQGGRLP